MVAYLTILNGRALRVLKHRTRRVKNERPILEFATVAELRRWLEHNHASSHGIFVRIYKMGSGVPSVHFEDVLDEGLCFGWSESKRLKGDAISYLQQFAPRKTHETTSARNRRHVERLIQDGRMTPAGLKALGLQTTQ
jgi:uncharacterized protein YdeI (YjbR/CyaY-like superfamily)